MTYPYPLLNATSMEDVHPALHNDILAGLAGVLYVRPTGDNSDTGTSWGTAKKDILGAYDALPAAGGIIYFESGSYVDATNTDRGLWIAGVNDPQHASVPTGWRQQKTSLLLCGIATVAQNGNHSIAATLNGGSGTDISKPLFWFSGCDQHIEVRNVINQALAKPMILGLQSDGSGSTNNSGFTFQNVNLRCNQNASYGPVIDITSAYWCWFRDCTFASTEQRTYNEDERAGVLIRGNSEGQGLIWLESCQFNGGGGVKQYSSSSVNIVISQTVQEGPTTGDLASAPIYWLASSGVDAGHAHILSVEQSDAGSTPNGTVKVAEGNSASVVVVYGGNAVHGPATVLGAYGSGRASWLKSPDGYGQTGFLHGRVIGATDAVRRAAPPTSIRFVNLCSQDPTGWSAGAGSWTTGKTDPFGLTNAAELSGNDSYSTIYGSSATDPSVGDWVFMGIWVRNVGADYANWTGLGPVRGGFTGAGNTFYDEDGTTEVTGFTLKSPYLGDGEWEWLSGARKVAAFPVTSGEIRLVVYGDTDRAMEYAYPVVAIIPSTWSESEVKAYTRHAATWPNTSPVGAVSTLRGQKLIAWGGLGVGNDAAASGPVGSVVKKIQVFDETGASLGYLPVYNSIT